MITTRVDNRNGGMTGSVRVLADVILGGDAASSTTTSEVDLRKAKLGKVRCALSRIKLDES